MIGEVGELVVTEPMPSMPLYLWGDRDGSRYRAAYFDKYPGVWRHGDWITITDRHSALVHGRCDATLNRYGVRLGTGKKLEVPVKRLLQGAAVEQVANVGAIDNPELLTAYLGWAKGLPGGLSDLP